MFHFHLFNNIQIDSQSKVEEIIQISSSSSTSNDDNEDDNDESEGKSDNKGNLVIIYFTANNCPPCKMIGPIYQDISEVQDFIDKNVQFVKVNVNDNPEIATKYNVDGWPTFLFIKDGQVKDEIVGGNAAKMGLYDMVVKYA